MGNEENMAGATQQTTANSTVNQKGNPNLKPCKHCGAMMAKSAKVCPSCGGKNKPPIYKRPWFIVLAVIFVLGMIGNSGKSSNSSSKPSSVDEESINVEDTNTGTTEKKEEKKKTYQKVTCKTMMDDLDKNALKAENKYKDKYVSVKGKLSNIDSSGKYISITPEEDAFAIVGVQCYIKNEEQKNAVMDMSTDDIIVVNGKITMVGEVMGYSLDIDSFGEQ